MADASPHESAAVTLRRATVTDRQRKQTNKQTIFGTWPGRLVQLPRAARRDVRVGARVTAFK